MARILWVGNSEADGKKNLEKYYLPADPNAELKKEGENWVIYASAEKQPKVTWRTINRE
jgi:hypothetical protein